MPNGFMGKILRVNLTDQRFPKKRFGKTGLKNLSGESVWPPGISMTKYPERSTHWGRTTS